jgi:hypothetical protein
VKSILRRRPSPALVIACIALFLSLGGISYGLASGSIDSREIKNNTIRSKDVRNNTLRTFDIRNNQIRGFDIRSSTIQGRDVAFNTLTGADISESDLAKVPSATAADSATSATNASTVGGMSVQKIASKQASGAGLTAIYSNAYFAIEAGCAGGSADARVVGVAGGPETNASVQAIGEGPADVAAHESTADLAPGAGPLLLAGGTEGAGTLTVATTDGRVSTVVFAAKSAPAFQGENVCSFRGTVTSG